MKRYKEKSSSLWEKYKESKNRRSNSSGCRRLGTGGFTLVELIVTLVVLGILLGLSVAGFSGYIRHAQFKKQNANAEAVFVAAQTQLTQYGERGQLTELKNAVTDGGKASEDSYRLSTVGTLIDADGNAYKADDTTIWQNYDQKTTVNEGSIYYLKVKKGDYQRYLEIQKRLNAGDTTKSGLTLEEKRIKALFDMIDPYIADKEMLDAAICIEFDPDPKVALVYSVFYNQNVKEFEYYNGAGETPSDTAAVAYINNRTRDYRWSNSRTGYYGARILSRGTDTQISRPIISEVRLVNEETLRLDWAVNDSEALKKLMYTINIYSVANASNPEGDLIASLTIGKAEVTELSLGDSLYSAVYYRKNADGTWPTTPQNFTFPLNVSSSKVSLTLDALDLAGDEKKTLAELSGTASIYRLGLNADNIYCSITGSRDNLYKTTVEKKSNTEHTMFAKLSASTGSSKEYTITNARHLNNIRYHEVQMAEADTAVYRVTADINWQDMRDHLALYRELVLNTDASTPCNFKPIRSLGAHSTLQSDDSGKIRVLKNFRFHVDELPEQLTTDVNASNYSPADTTGLFVVNHGTINKLTMEDVVSFGSQNHKNAATNENVAANTEGATGTFCGINRGTMTNLTVQGDNCDISGAYQVGGIAGKMSGSAKATNVVNRAEVKGFWYVGGIAGFLETTAAADSMVLNGCKNYGRVKCVSPDGTELTGSDEEARYLGGIAGYSRRTAGDMLLSECISSPNYPQSEVDSILAALNEKKPEEAMAFLHGYYVGGIIGYNENAVLTNCTTERESERSVGYVVGRQYVGGVLGYNGGSDTTVLEANAQKGVNQVHVIGGSYVGGVVGCNARQMNAEEDGADYLDPETNLPNIREVYDSNLIIRNWTNQGAVIGVHDYVGGITGCNYGNIENCNTDVNYNQAIQTLLSNYTLTSYAGGIAGYNAGLIRSDTRILVNAAVSGQYYVGGVAGFNAIGGMIDNYGVQGGYVRGKRFVGGYVGLNAEQGIFKDKTIEANPNQVIGDYFVGGIVGANLMPITSNVNTVFAADNFLGELDASCGAFAGGFIGYNYLLNSDVFSTAPEASKASNDRIQAAADRLCSETDSLRDMSKYQIDAGEKDKKLSDVELETISGDYQNLTDPLVGLFADVSNADDTTYTFTITGTKVQSDTYDTPVRLEGITALVYAGGVVGYNQETSALNIAYVENVTPVKARAYITCREEWPSDDPLKENKLPEANYAYTGGIIGKVTNKVVVNSCKNRDVGSVVTRGTFRGGLAELNYGLIENCTAGNLGDNTTSNVGGLVGINVAKKTTTIENGITKTVELGVIDCTATGQIMGEDYVGGLVAHNYGLVKNPTLEDCTVYGTGQYVGGVVAYGFTGSQIEFDKSVTLGVTVDGSASKVGALVGKNEGGIELKFSGSNYVYNQGTVTGNSYVGGFIGVQQGAVTIEKLYNQAEVQADSGYAGGIAAFVGSPDGTDQVTISNCVNDGTVTVLTEVEHPWIVGSNDNEQEKRPEPEPADPDLDLDYQCSLAGGITAVNNGIITGCVDYKEISITGGYAGGIAAVNHRWIKESEVHPNLEETSQKPLVFEGDDLVGGIAAINCSEADDSTVTVGSSTSVKKDETGITDCRVYRIELKNQTNSTNSKMGAVCGQNNGIIRNCAVGVEKPTTGGTAAASDDDYDKQHIEASDYVLDATAEAGGGAVRNDQAYTFSERKDVNAVILTSLASDAMVGGVTGLNKGTIEGKSTEKSTVVAAEVGFHDVNGSYGYLGGIAGVNRGEISYYEFNGLVHGTASNPQRMPEYDPNYDYEKNGSTVYGYGGIVGMNGDDKNRTGADLEQYVGTIKKCQIGRARITGTGDPANKANVGGFAGVNGKQSVIKEVQYAPLDDNDEANNFTYKASANNSTLNYSGAVWIGTAENGYGHLGGVVGYNYGEISMVNWSGTYGDVRDNYVVNDADTDDVGKYKPDILTNGKATEVNVVDRTSVLIVDGRGNVGGAIGYNRRTGTLDHAVTGYKWLVIAEKQIQDNAAGGMIGYNIGDGEIASCDNHADVIKWVKESNSVGGIIGRNEIGTGSTWRIYDCRNYGDIYATGRGAGIVGQIKYRLGTIEKCRNYGKIYSTSDGAGGVVAFLYSITGGETLYITDCENHGTVNASSQNISAGGILATGLSGTTVRIRGCVNTGLIGSASANSGGIVGNRNNSTMSVDYSHNYGYSLGQSTNFGGIASKGDSITMTRDFSVVDYREIMPIAVSNYAGKDAYYFAASSGAAEEKSEKFWVKELAMSSYSENGSTRSGCMQTNNLYHMLDKTAPGNNTYFNPVVNNNANSAVSKSNYGQFEITLNQKVWVDSLEIMLNRDTNRRKYSFEVYAFEDDEWVLVYDQNAAADLIGTTEKTETVNISMDDVYTDKIKITGIKAVVDSTNAAANAAFPKLTVYGKVQEDQAEPQASEETASGSGNTTNSGGGPYVSAVYTRTKGPEDSTGSGTTTASGDYGIPLYLKAAADDLGAENIAEDKYIEKLSESEKYTLDQLLLADTAANKNKRFSNSSGSYNLFLKLDPYLVLDSGASALSAPALATSVTAAAGAYKVTWTDPSGQAEYYTVTYQYYAADGTTLLGTFDQKVYDKNISVPSNYSDGGKNAAKIKVTVQSHITGTGGVDIASDSAEQIYVVNPMVPMPQIKWELDTTNGLNNNCYRVILDNQADYQEFVDKYQADYGVTMDQIEISMIVGSPSVSKTFKVSDGGCLVSGSSTFDLQPGVQQLATALSSANTTITSSASWKKISTSIGTLDPSEKVVRETVIPNYALYEKYGKNSKVADIRMQQVQNSTDDKDVGFSGSTADTLAYKVKLRKQQNWTPNIRTEFVAVDPAIGADTALANSSMQISTTDTGFSTILLTGFPSDILNQSAKKDAAGNEVKDEAGNTVTEYNYKSFWIRSYPASQSNNIVYQGHQVKGDASVLTGTDTLSDLVLTADEVKGLYVTNDGYITNTHAIKLVDDGEVAPGYVIERQGEDSYSIYYNALLYLMETDPPAYPTGTVDDKNYTTSDNTKVYMKNQVQYHFIDMATELKAYQPTPVAYVNAAYSSGAWADGDYQNSDQFILTWDQPASSDGSAYGTGYDEKAEYTLTVVGITQEGKTTMLVNKKLIKTSELINIVDEDGNTKSLHNVYAADASNWTFKQIQVTLARNGIEENGMTTIFPSQITPTYDMKRRLNPIGDLTIALTKNAQGIVQKDGMNYTINWSALTDAEMRAALDHYEVTVVEAGKESDTNALRVTANTRTAAEIGAENVPDDTTVSIVLNKFSQGQQVDVYVRAIARADSTFRDSTIGTTKTMAMPEPLRAPEMKDDYLRAELPVEGATTLTGEEFENGCLTLLASSSNAYTSSGSYQIAIQLYPTENDAKNQTNEITSESDPNLVLPEKSDDNKTMMAGNLNTASYTISGLSSQYAGYWVRVIMRAVSNSNISSVWTEDDDDNSEIEYVKVTPYRVFELPKVKLDHASTTNDGTYTENYDLLINGVKAEGFPQVEVTQQKIVMDSVDYAVGYQITMIQTPKNPIRKASDSDAEQRISDVNDLIIDQQADGSYKVTYESSEDADIDPSKADDIGRTPKKMEYTISKDGTGSKPIELPYQKEILISQTGIGNYTILIKAYLEAALNDGKMQFSLILPDYEGMKDSGDGSVITDQSQNGLQYPTEQILIQAKAPVAASAEELIPYVDSDWIGIIHDTESGSFASEVHVLENMNAEVVMPEFGSDTITFAEASNLSGYAYQNVEVGAGDTRYLMKVTSADGGKDYGTFAVEYSSDVFNKTEEVWLPDGFEGLNGKEIKLYFRNIYDATEDLATGGLSAWSTESLTGVLPVSQETRSVELTQTLSEGQNHILTNTSSASTYSLKKVRRSNGSAVLNIKQKQVSWDYLFEDTKIDGYTLRLQRNTLADYNLKIDLSRDRFGGMAGLADYLTAEGKLLYKVAYDAEGDIVSFDEVHEEPEDETTTVNPADETETASPSDAQMQETTPEETTPEETITEETTPVETTEAATETKSEVLASDSNAQTENSVEESSAAETTTDAATDTAEDTTMAGVIYLECRLKAKWIMEDEKTVGIQFTLTLPDAAFDQITGGKIVNYEESYDDGIYSTDGIVVLPIMINRYFLKPDEIVYFLEDEIIDDRNMLQ